MLVAGYNEEDLRFLTSVVNQRCISGEELSQCLSMLKESRARGDSQTLAELLVSSRLLSREQVRSIIDSQAQAQGGPRLVGYGPGVLLGQGEVAEVWRAEPLDIPGLPTAGMGGCALKWYRPYLSQEPPFIWSLITRYKAARELRHPQLLTPLELDKACGRFVVVYPLGQGQTLKAILSREERLGAARVRRILDATLAALAALDEAGLAHGDIKTSNILVGDDDRVQLTDVGAAKPLDLLTRSPYISPEQACGVFDVDIRSDLYSLGCVAYHLLSGAPPFVETLPQVAMARHIGEAPRPLDQGPGGQDAQLAAFVHRLLAKKPVERFAGAAQARRALL